MHVCVLVLYLDSFKMASSWLHGTKFLAVAAGTNKESCHQLLLPSVLAVKFAIIAGVLVLYLDSFKIASSWPHGR